MTELNEKTILSLSKDLNEPKWLLEERLKAFKTFTLLTASGKKFDFSANFDSNSYSTDFKGKGVSCDSIYDFLEDKNRKDMAKMLFQHRYLKPAHSVEAAFANAFFQEVNFYGPENEKVKEGSVQIAPKAGISLNFFIVPDNFKLKIETSFASRTPTTSTFFLSEIYGSDGSVVDKTEKIDAQTTMLTANLLNKNSKLKSKTVLTSSAFYENSSVFMDEGSEAIEKATIQLAGSSKLECKSYAFHNCPGAKSDISYKGVLRDSAFARVDALAKIAKNAPKSDSYVSAHILLLDKGAKAIATPDLEILNNDVVAGHSASVGQIDEEQLFYLMSRGLTEDEAKALIVEGFLA
jgi:hypothetical protein